MFVLRIVRMRTWRCLLFTMCACVLEDVGSAQYAHAFSKMFVLRNVRMHTWKCLFCAMCACVLEEVCSAQYAHAFSKMLVLRMPSCRCSAFWMLHICLHVQCTFLDCPLHSKVCLPKPLSLIWSNIVKITYSPPGAGWMRWRRPTAWWTGCSRSPGGAATATAPAPTTTTPGAI